MKPAVNAESGCVITLWLSHCRKSNSMSVYELLSFGTNQQLTLMKVVDEERSGRN